MYPVEAVSLALALQKRSPDLRRRIRHKARHTNSFGPCPLLEDGACLMYDARAVICRTHGLPMLTEYRGHRSIGYRILREKLPESFPHPRRRRYRPDPPEQLAGIRQPQICQHG
ncbi:MAG: hypothetical protein JRE36_03770 [Deltaproteobacteria bacterium]|nr:hypothetical protein [Deltaproteobacteria bacterium]